MERSAGYSSVRGSVFSATSLAEGSEPISEAEEINEVNSIIPAQLTDAQFRAEFCVMF